jgi:GTPase SAR1 family protein
MSNRKEVIKLKVCVVGDGGSGKSSFIRRLIGDSWEGVSSTEEYEVHMYCVEAKTYYLEVQLWDCSANHLNFHKYLREAYFRNSSAALLLCDLTDPHWRDRAHLWISEAYENQCYLVYAIGTK